MHYFVMELLKEIGYVFYTIWLIYFDIKQVILWLIYSFSSRIGKRDIYCANLFWPPPIQTHTLIFLRVMREKSAPRARLTVMAIERPPLGVLSSFFFSPRKVLAMNYLSAWGTISTTLQCIVKLIWAKINERLWFCYILSGRNVSFSEMLSSFDIIYVVIPLYNYKYHTVGDIISGTFWKVT